MDRFLHHATSFGQYWGMHVWLNIWGLLGHEISLVQKMPALNSERVAAVITMHYEIFVYNHPHPPTHPATHTRSEPPRKSDKIYNKLGFLKSKIRCSLIFFFANSHMTRSAKEKFHSFCKLENCNFSGQVGQAIIQKQDPPSGSFQQWTPKMRPESYFSWGSPPPHCLCAVEPAEPRPAANPAAGGAQQPALPSQRGLPEARRPLRQHEPLGRPAAHPDIAGGGATALFLFAKFGIFKFGKTCGFFVPPLFDVVCKSSCCIPPDCLLCTPWGVAGVAPRVVRWQGWGLPARSPSGGTPPATRTRRHLPKASPAESVWFEAKLLAPRPSLGGGKRSVLWHGTGFLLMGYSFCLIFAK